MIIFRPGPYTPPDGTPPGGGFARKPVITTPTATNAIRNFFVNSDAAAPGGTGTEINPFKYIAEAEAIKQAGDHIHLTGSVTHGNQGANDFIGMGANSGTIGAAIVYKRKTGSPRPTVQLGGGANGWNTVYFNGKGYHFFDDLIFRANAGADSARAVALLGGSTSNKFVRVGLRDTSFKALNSPDNEFWEVDSTGSNGDVTGNTGDFFELSNGSHRCKIMKSSFDGISGHSAGIVGNVQSGSTDVDDVELFDNFFRNTWAGGLQVVGNANRAKVHWCRVQGVGRDANPSGYPRGSRDGMQLACRNGIFQFNTVYDSWRGVMCSAYSFGGTPQQYSGNRFSSNVMVGCQSIGLLIHHGPVTDPELSQINNTWENNVLWDNHRTTDSGDISNGSDYFFNGAYNLLTVDHYASSNGGAGNGEFAIDSGNWHGNIIRNNIAGKATGAQRLLMYVGSTSAPPQNNRYFTAAELAANSAVHGGNIVGNPLLVAPDGNDFRLQAGSLAIDAAYPSAGLTFLGAAPDIGTYEYGGSD